MTRPPGLVGRTMAERSERRFWLGAMLMIGAAACTRDPSDSPARPAELPPATPVPPLHADDPLERLREEAGLADDQDPEARHGDLRHDLEAFRTLYDCVAARANSDPLLEDALDAVGYTTLAHDACRMLDAMKSHEPSRCAPIASSALRARCTTWVAAYAGNPELCPIERELGIVRGRDPVCLARARRDPRICAAAPSFEQPRCLAMVSGDPELCRGDRPCTREVMRWKSLIAPVEASDAGGRVSRIHIEVHGTSGTPDPPTTVFELSNEAEAGVVVRPRKNGADLFVGEPHHGSWIGWDSPLATSRAYFELRIPSRTGEDAGVSLVLADGPGVKRPDVPSARFEVLLPGIGVLSSANGDSEVELRVGRLGLEPGAPVDLTLGLAVHDAARSFALRCEIATFVRDTLPSKREN